MNFIEIRANNGGSSEDSLPDYEPIDPMSDPQEGTTFTDGNGNTETKKTMVINTSLEEDGHGIRFYSKNGASRVTDPKAINDECIVDVGNGIKTDVGTAKRMGLISQREVESWGSNTKAPEVKPKPKQTQLPQADLMSPEARNVVNLIGKKTGSPRYVDSLMMKAISHVYHNEIGNPDDNSFTPPNNDGESAINELASAIDLEPDQAERVANDIINSIHSRAIVYAHHLGVDGKALFKWAAEKLSPGAYTHVLQRLYLNDVKVIPELIERKRLNNRF